MGFQSNGIGIIARDKPAPYLCGCGKHKTKVDGVFPTLCDDCRPQQATVAPKPVLVASAPVPSPSTRVPWMEERYSAGARLSRRA